MSKETTTLIAYAEYYGDPSVGIPHQSFKIELHDVDMEYVEAAYTEEDEA